MLPIDRESLAWSAGLFDGEGWCSAARYSTKTRGMTATLTIGVAQANREVLDRFHRTVGLGTIIQHRKIVPGRTFMYTWKAYGFQNVQAVFAMLWTWLGSIKRAQILRCLEDAKRHPTNLKRLFNAVQVADIRAMLKDGVAQWRIAQKYGCPRQYIWRIAHNRSYRPEEIRNVAD